MNQYHPSEEENKIEAVKVEEETLPALYENNPDPVGPIEETEAGLNAKILEITLKIKEDFPELSKYIEEMPVTNPDVENPEMSIKHLKNYYFSLQSLVNKYHLENNIPEKEKN